MDAGRIKFRRPVGKRRIPRPPAFCDRHQSGQLVQRCLNPDGGGGQGQRTGQIDLSGAHRIAGLAQDRQRLAGQGRSVDFGGSGHDGSVNRGSGTRADQYLIAHAQLRHGNLLRHPIVDTPRARDFQRCQLFGGRPCGRARPRIQPAPGQQKERQRQGGVEIGVLARQPRFPQRSGHRQYNRERDRDVHIQLPRPQCSPCAACKRLR